MNGLIKNKKGFSAIELLLVIVILVLIGAVGFLIYKNHHKSTPVSVTTTASAKTTSPNSNGSNVLTNEQVGIATKTCSTSGPGTIPVAATKAPLSFTITLPTSLANSFVFYTDSTRSITPVLAPVGWICNISLSEDGSASIIIAPTQNDIAILNSTNSQGKNVQAVVVEAVSACVSCAYGFACPLIPALVNYNKTNDDGDYKCTTIKPSTETEIWVKGSSTQSSTISTTDIVKFSDPIGVTGDGFPSGGPYPAIGALISNTHGAPTQLETCTLPTAQQASCGVIVSDFLNRWVSPTY